MARQATSRITLAGAIVALALAAAALGGDSPWSVLVGLVGGAAAVLVAWRPYFFPEPAAAPEPPADGRDIWARTILGAMPDPMLLIEEGRIAVANAAATGLLGDWIEGQDVRLALRHPATVERLSRTAGAEVGIEKVEVAGIGHAERRWTMTVATLEGGLRIVHLADRSEAIAAERMRVDFVANASHELRTPLATILGFIETLQDEGAASNPELRSRFLGLMHGEGKRMQQLIEDLMSLSRIEAERFVAPRDPVDLLELVAEVRTGCAHLLEQRSNSLVLENEAASSTVPGDRSQLLQLLRNLVVNAVKYGRPDAPVLVRLEGDGPERVRLTVIDRGEGIPAEHLPRLTERFYRVDPGRSRAVGGTGLGLAIVKHIVSRHRGRLDIRSRLGEGSRFAVSLPRFPEQ